MDIPVELDLDLTDAELYRSGFPHTVFDDLRARGPVLGHAPMAPDERSHPTPFWVVTRHAEVQQANRDWATFSAIDGPGIEPSPSERRGHTIVTTDPTPHTRMRRLISAGFTPRMIGRLGDLVDRRVADVLDRAADSGSVDFVRDIAYPVPMHLIADIMGIPEPDRPWVFERTDTLLRSGDPASGLTPEDRQQAQLELFGYATELGETKRRHPADDVWSLLASAEIVEDDGSITTLRTYELDMFFLILSLAGSETTRNALSQGVMALIVHPDQMALLRSEPALIDSAVEEILRWSSPVALFGRTATCDTELGGRAISEGDRVTLWYPSANRDERVFADPHRFDITRTPNPHVAFGGGGPHFCLGSNLARREIRTVFDQVLARFDHLDLAGEPEWMVAGPDQSVAVSVDRLPVIMRKEAAPKGGADPAGNRACRLREQATTAVETPTRSPLPDVLSDQTVNDHT